MLRGGAIGDFLLTLPALDALRVRWPDSHIELIGYPHIAALAVAGGLVNRLLSLDRSDMARLFARKAAIPEELAAYVRSFDIVLSYLYDPDGTLRDHLVSAGVRLFLHGTPLVAGGHAADHLMKPLAGLAIYPDGPSCPRLRLPPSAVLAARQRLAADGAPVVVLHPGSGGRAKRWPIEAFLCLAAALRSRHLRVTFLAGEADHDLVEPMATAGEAAIRDLPLTEVAAILAAADGYVGNDSGITHLAAAVGCRVVALFGGTDPAVWGPRGQNVRILRGQVGGAWDVRGIARDEVVTALGRCE